jgi:hypothetical protein
MGDQSDEPAERGMTAMVVLCFRHALARHRVARSELSNTLPKTLLSPAQDRFIVDTPALASAHKL